MLILPYNFHISSSDDCAKGKLKAEPQRRTRRRRKENGSLLTFHASSFYIIHLFIHFYTHTYIYLLQCVCAAAEINADEAHTISYTCSVDRYICHTHTHAPALARSHNTSIDRQINGGQRMRDAEKICKNRPLLFFITVYATVAHPTQSKP